MSEKPKPTIQLDERTMEHVALLKRPHRASLLLEQAEDLLDCGCPDCCDCEHCQWLGDYDEWKESQ